MIFIFLLTIIILGGCVGALGPPMLYWTHRKGYPGPGWKSLVILPLLLGMFGSMTVLVWGSPMAGSDIARVAGVLGWSLLVFVPQIAGIGGSFLVLRLLPKRKMRVEGSRKSKSILYVVSGYAILILAVIPLIISLRSGSALPQAIKIIAPAAALSGMMFYLTRRAKTSTVEEAISHDPRPPLLYLRSFDQEAGHFVEVSPLDAAKYSEITSYAPTYTSYHLTLEQFLARKIKDTVGPFIALGNPTDYLPPEGAFRTYAADGGWQEYFTDLSNRSVGILMQMGNSDNLNWELVSIRERSLQKKLFVVTPPPPSDAGKYSLTGFFVRLNERIKGTQPASWDRFAANLERAGYKPTSEAPGPGAVVAFDEHCQAMTLVSGAKTPTEYVDAICGQLGNLPEQQAAAEIPDPERARVEKYGVQIVICSSCGMKNSLSFPNCIKCSKDLSKEKPVPNPYL